MTSRRPPALLVALAAIAASVVLVSGIVTLSVRGSSAGLTGQIGPRTVAVPSPTSDPEAARAAAIRTVLDLRGSAVRARDETAFLSTVDLTDQAFANRQRALFASLSAVPFAAFHYELLDQPGLASISGWSPAVSLEYQIAGYDPTPVDLRQQYTFAPAGGTWLLRDDGLGELSRGMPLPAAAAVQPAIWDVGTVSVVRGQRSLVLGVGDGSRLQTLADEADQDIPDVTAVWGTDWPQQAIVIAPASEVQFAALIGQRGDVSKLEAVQSAEVRAVMGQAADQTSPDQRATGNRITINPGPFAALSSAGRRVVMTHELTHVATRASTGPQTPLWLVEGFADYVGFLHSGLPLSEVTLELRSSLRTSGIPDHVPLDPDFLVTNAQPAVAYEASWMACRLVARAGGDGALVKLYRAVGAAAVETGSSAAGNEQDQAVQLGLAESGIMAIATPAQFVAAWRADLRSLVG